MSMWPKREVALLTCGLCCISFALGCVADGYLTRFGTYREVKEAILGIHVNWIAPRIREPWERPDYYYYVTRHRGEGVQRHDAAKAHPGYTLFSASFEPAAYLVDMQGRKVHEWRMPFSAAWRSPPHVDLPVPDKYVYFRRTHLFPNGDLLAVYETPGHWPYAYGLVKLDKNSKLLWAYADLVNHDLEVAADGRIYTLVHQVRTKSEPGLRQLRPSVIIDDAVVVLSSDGRELERISVLDAFLLASRYVPLLNQDDRKDVLHTISLQIVTPEIARRFPFVQAGQILLSHNYRGTISILDPRTRKIVWARQVGFRQHSARFLSDGTIGVFKNEDNLEIGGRSRVVALDPASGRETWAFAGDETFTFESLIQGSFQQLPNGNFLVTETTAGRLFEVTPQREIVWEYRVGHELHGKTPAIFEALRIDPAALTFLARQDAP